MKKLFILLFVLSSCATAPPTATPSKGGSMVFKFPEIKQPSSVPAPTPAAPGTKEYYKQIIDTCESRHLAVTEDGKDLICKP